jgi:hypothetical protein
MSPCVSAHVWARGRASARPALAHTARNTWVKGACAIACLGMYGECAFVCAYEFVGEHVSARVSARLHPYESLHAPARLRERLPGNLSMRACAFPTMARTLATSSARGTPGHWWAPVPAGNQAALDSCAAVDASGHLDAGAAAAGTQRSGSKRSGLGKSAGSWAGPASPPPPSACVKVH